MVKLENRHTPCDLIIAEMLLKNKYDFRNLKTTRKKVELNAKRS